MTLDMTRGRPAGLLVRFALPLMLSSLLQQLYTMCDSLIVGRLLGTDAFAAIGSAAYLHWFALSMLLGATGGFGVALAQRFGAKDEEGFSRFFGASIVLTLIIGAIMTALGMGFIHPLLQLLGTLAVLIGIGATEELLPRLVADGLRPDVIVVDPPRKGCEPQVLEAIIAAKPERVVYVSCGAPTLARDAKLLTEGGYKAEKVQCVDMFCWTGDVETVMRFSLAD